MKLLGFNLTKIDAEKKSSSFEGLKIETKIDIKDILEAKQDVLQFKDKVVMIQFSYDINYKKDIAKLSLEGNLLLSVDEKMFSEIIDKWKNKEMPGDFKLVLFNIIMKKTSLKALELEDDLALPFHIQFPSVRKKE